MCGDYFQNEQGQAATHIEIDAASYAIVKDSVILLEQLRTIDKRRLKDKVCHLDAEILQKVNHALCISLELPTIAGPLVFMCGKS